MYELRPIDLSSKSLKEISALLQQVFPASRHLTPEYLEWQYSRNPAGKVMGMNAYRGGRLVGHYATLPMRIRLFAKEGRTALLLNLAIEKQHRGHGLMEQMGRRTLEAGRHAGFDCLIGIANDASTYAIGYPLGYKKVCQLEARVGLGPLPPRREGFAPDFERLWDRETLRWRLANPSVRYWLRRRRGRCEVIAPTGRYGVVALLGTVEADLAEGAPPPGIAWRPRLWIGVDPARRWGRSSYWGLPRWLRPVPLNFMFLDLADPPRPLAAECLLWTSLDFDAY